MSIPRANWVSYVAFWHVFATARGFAGEVFEYFAFDPSVFALTCLFLYFCIIPVFPCLFPLVPFPSLVCGR